MSLRCEEIDDLLAPFALDALEPEDRQAVLEHLVDCRDHDADLADYRQVASSLALAVDGLEAPVGLSDRVLGSFDSEVRGADASPPAPMPLPVPAVIKRPGLLWRAGFAYAVAAALLVLAVGLGAWNLSLRGDDASDTQAVVKTVQQDGMALHVTYLEDEDILVLDVSMPPLASGSAYQGWQITDAGPVSLGLLPSSGVATIRADLSGATALAVSVEPAGGSPAPTSTPVLVTDF